ncbi:MAG: SpoIIE family protein phosphatase [Bacteroidota bacterium]|nr:SpoIIE family protein phosphatase [Bacteroidota bacterium]
MNIKKAINIFIVEDNNFFSLALKMSIENAFENKQVQVFLFETGEACMERFIVLNPELVILDYYLNSKSLDAIDGLQVLQKIRNCNSETSVIMLTSNDHIDTALKSFHGGASDYVVKTEKQFKKIIDSIFKILADKELILENEMAAIHSAELVLAERELVVKNKEKEKWVNQLININKKIAFQNKAQIKHADELKTVKAHKLEMEKSKLAVEEKNKNITDSITYAKRIQQAKLPKKEEIYSALPDSFVLFKPKDIVSGDFYFFKKKGQSIFIAAADCTGHGVPGALMSMIGLEKLNVAVKLSEDTSEILHRLNKGIKKSLRQSDNIDSTKDGMDIALCSINTQSRIIKYAGANRPMWIVRKGHTSVDEIKPTKKAIGGFTDNDQHFDTHEIQLNERDTIYIFSDGYADTFGGEFGKKMMSRRFKETLLHIQDKTMLEQEKYLDNFLESWKAELEQVDDVLVIGIRL